MPQEPRKATDVLLEVESKVSTLLDIIRAQDLNIKVLSNKLNDVIAQLKQQQAGPPRITVEAVQTTPSSTPQMPAGFTQIPAGDPERTIPVTAESKLPQAGSPQGFRRTSRPETFAAKKLSGDNAYLNKPSEEIVMPMQMPQAPPGRSSTETVTQNLSKKVSPPGPQPNMPDFPEHKPMTQGQVPTMQRVVDKNGKSIFLADVKIVDLATGQPVFKTRTNGTGKWMASLGVGAYQVTITKMASESTNKGKLEAVQEIQIDGTRSPFELPMLIIK